MGCRLLRRGTAQTTCWHDLCAGDGRARVSTPPRHRRFRPRGDGLGHGRRRVQRRTALAARRRRRAHRRRWLGRCGRRLRRQRQGALGGPRTGPLRGLRQLPRRGGIGDAPFLAGPDRYASVLSWPGVVVSDPRRACSSPIGDGGGHTGITSTPSQRSSTAWRPGSRPRRIHPETPRAAVHRAFHPILGFNAVYLNEVDDKLVAWR